jgi:HlyD family secretion protein
MKRIVSTVLVAGLVGAGVWGYFYAQSRGNAPRYRTAQVERGPLTATVSASGNLNAVTTVLVGSQVSGQIKELFADFNTVVKRNQVIARIDPAIFQAKVSQAQADLDSGRAAVLNQEAQVERARADLENARAAHAESRANTARAQVTASDARRDLDRKSELFRRELIAKSDLDSAQATHDSALAMLDAARAKEQSLMAGIQSAQAQLRVAGAMLQSARAQVEQKQAALRQAQVDLEHTTIRAPVDGVVVSRAVDVGQTVAASLQAPTLFTIAGDLTKMQVEVSVDTVDSFPGQTFTGVVTQIRKAAQVVQNVVTYTVVVAVDNPGGRLLPGMTANARMIVAEKPSVLKVPNSALRFRPPAPEGGAPAGGAAAPAARPAGRGERPGGGAGRPSAEQIRERLVRGLGLGPEQQAKLDPILAETRRQMLGLQSLPEQERPPRAQKIREAARARILEILTPEQRARYDELALGGDDPRGGTPGRVYVLDGDRFRQVPLTLGLSDGASTEVLRGDLNEGQEVVVGTIGPAGTSRPGGGGPRMRL